MGATINDLVELIEDKGLATQEEATTIREKLREHVVASVELDITGYDKDHVLSIMRDTIDIPQSYDADGKLGVVATSRMRRERPVSWSYAAFANEVEQLYNFIQNI